MILRTCSPLLSFIMNLSAFLSTIINVRSIFKQLEFEYHLKKVDTNISFHQSTSLFCCKPLITSQQHVKSTWLYNRLGVLIFDSFYFCQDSELAHRMFNSCTPTKYINNSLRKLKCFRLIIRGNQTSRFDTPHRQYRILDAYIIYLV